jgi:hypothetical protein
LASVGGVWLTTYILPVALYGACDMVLVAVITTSTTDVPFVNSALILVICAWGKNASVFDHFTPTDDILNAVAVVVAVLYCGDVAPANEVVKVNVSVGPNSVCPVVPLIVKVACGDGLKRTTSLINGVSLRGMLPH